MKAVGKYGRTLQACSVLQACSAVTGGRTQGTADDNARPDRRWDAGVLIPLSSLKASLFLIIWRLCMEGCMEEHRIRYFPHARVPPDFDRCKVHLGCIQVAPNSRIKRRTRTVLQRCRDADAPLHPRRACIEGTAMPPAIQGYLCLLKPSDFQSKSVQKKKGKEGKP